MENSPRPAADDSSLSDSELLSRFDRRSQRADDAAAMQAALCIFISAGLFAAQIFVPDIADPVFRLIRSLASQENDLFTNPLKYAGGLL